MSSKRGKFILATLRKPKSVILCGKGELAVFNSIKKALSARKKAEGAGKYKVYMLIVVPKL